MTHPDTLNNDTLDKHSAKSGAMLLLIAISIALAAINLRTAVTSVGALLPALQDALGMSSAVAGVLTMLPALCFACVGAAAAPLARKFGDHRMVVWALVLLVAGLVIRCAFAEVWIFLIASTLALSGCAVGNVLLPSLVKRHFPRRIGAMTTVYSTALASGTTLAAAVTVPVAQMAGSWRVGLGVWIFLALTAIVPWLSLLKQDNDRHNTSAVALRNLLKSKLAWAMAIYFGSQSLQAYITFGWISSIYVDFGLSKADGALMLSILTGVQIPISLMIPMLASKLKQQRGLVVILVGIYVIGYLGLFFAPLVVPWLWAVLIGVAGGAFPLALTLIGMRAKSAAGTAALSGFAQSIGYGMASLGPLFVGVLYDLTNSWTAPFVLIFAMLIPQLIAGLYCGSNRMIEDEI